MLSFPRTTDSTVVTSEQLLYVVAAAVLPGLVEFESVWTIANRVYDQYVKSEAAA